MRNITLYIRRALLAVVGLQLTVIASLMAIDAWRKRSRPQGKVPANPQRPTEVGDNEVQLFAFGEDLYEAMLEAIRSAETRIFFETFIWKGDSVGRMFKRELEAAANRGVDVYVIYDTFANLVVSPSFKRFAANVHVLAFRLFPKPWQMLDPRSYGRDHRKIMIVDGDIGFIGGYNIGTTYATQWRDTHLSLRGASVWDLENAFVDFWNINCGGKLPQLTDAGTRAWESRIRVHRNVPMMLVFPIRAMYLEAIDRAQHHIFITQAYFIPDRSLRRGLLAAAERGVDVRVLLPEVSNHIVADWLSRGFYTQFLAGGIRLLRYKNAMVHAKTATIDNIWTTVGTANIDRLSLAGNYEINIEIFDQGVAQQMEAIFAADSKHTEELTLEEWVRRPLIAKFSELVLAPLRPLL
jgi:cardiolipin synthase A/B